MTHASFFAILGRISLVLSAPDGLFQRIVGFQQRIDGFRHGGYGSQDLCAGIGVSTGDTQYIDKIQVRSLRYCLIDDVRQQANALRSDLGSDDREKLDE